MKSFASLLIGVLVCAGCSDQVPNTSAAQRILPPPPPSEPRMTEAQAKANALALGVGACDDLTKIKVLAFGRELGQDAQLDRMVVNFDGYKECLISKLTDRTEIPDPAMRPKRFPYTVGNLAYDVIGRSGRFDYMTCVPAEISESWQYRGSQALTEWLVHDGNPEALQVCVQRHLGGT